MRPCPSGHVLALRIRLLDLRDGSPVEVALDFDPRDPVWSPSGRALASPSAKGALGLVQVGGGAGSR